MKNILFLLCFLFYGLSTIAQTDKKWLVSMDIGVQAHDKRLYHWPEFPARNLLESQPEIFGTYQLGASMSREIIKNNKFSTSLGIGLSAELATFLRPIDIDEAIKIIRYTEKYYKNLIQLPIQLKYNLSERLSATLGILPQFNFLTISTHKIDENFTWKEFDLYSIELAPGIEYKSDKFIYGLKYRAFQVKKIDPILFYSTSVYVMGEEKHETYNPFKLWFSMGYEF